MLTRMRTIVEMNTGVGANHQVVWVRTNLNQGTKRLKQYASISPTTTATRWVMSTPSKSLPMRSKISLLGSETNWELWVYDAAWHIMCVIPCLLDGKWSLSECFQMRVLARILISAAYPLVHNIIPSRCCVVTISHCRW